MDNSCSTTTNSTYQNWTTTTTTTDSHWVQMQYEDPHPTNHTFLSLDIIMVVLCLKKGI